MDTGNLLPAWQVVARLQARIEKTTRADAAGLAQEEALTDLLGDFEAGLTPTAEDLERHFSSLSRNRRRKHHHRAAIASEKAEQHQVWAAKEQPHVLSVDQSDLLARIRRAVTSREWHLLYGAALGMRAEVLGGAASMGPGAIRVCLHRLRRRLAAVA